MANERDVFYRILIDDIVELEPPLCPSCGDADGMYILAPEVGGWFLEIQRAPCGYTKMALTFEESHRRAILVLYASDRDYHRFVANDVGPDSNRFTCRWESDTPGIPCDARSASVHVERIRSIAPQAACTEDRPFRPISEHDPIELLAARPWNRGRLENAHLQAIATDPQAGRLEFFVNLARDPDGSVVVARAMYEHEGSRQGAAYAALLSLLVEGQSLSEIRKITLKDLHEFVGQAARDSAAAELALDCLRTALART